jgi:predicted metal-dependent hydrolase
MPKSEHNLPDIGPFFITKKRGQRSLRLRVDPKGSVQVSIPWMVPKAVVYDFVKSKRDWIKEQQQVSQFKPYNGMLQLMIQENSTTVRSKQDGRYVVVPFKGRYDPTDPDQLNKIQKAVMKALRNEAERLLLPRLSMLAEMYGFTYRSSSVKMVTGRWGSCDSNKHISLNLYLVQLPIEMVDFVLIHELAHTVQMNHSPEFWKIVEAHCPEYKDIRRKMRDMQPKIYDAKTFMA